MSKAAMTLWLRLKNDSISVTQLTINRATCKGLSSKTYGAQVGVNLFL
jgi:hypothetical protein